MAGMDILHLTGWTYDWLRHGFSTRLGGESTIYGEKSLNLGWTKEDDPRKVQFNRKIFVAAVERVEPSEVTMKLVTVRQIHSGDVRVIRASDGAKDGVLEMFEGKAVLEGDGLITDVPGVLIAVGTADCVPVFVADVANRAVGAFHAGWRGTAAKIAEQGIALMRKEYNSRPEDLIAAIGPSIGPCCYIVGDEVRAAFDSQFKYSDELFHKTEDSLNGKNQFFVDLWAANQRQFLAAGLAPERVTVLGECTACTRDSAGRRRYFSHRAEGGVTGRMLNAIGVAAE